MLESCFQLKQEDALQPKEGREIVTSQGIIEREAQLGAILNGKLTAERWLFGQVQ